LAVYPNSYLPRVKTVLLLAFSLVLALAPAGPATAASAPGKPLRVVLVSGAESYNSDQAFADLAQYLQREFGMSCEVLRMCAYQTHSVGI
jgi:ABC-type phosphate/phosphonate transport system substrate-binding protein